MRLPTHTVLQVVKPLYRIPESGLHWYQTYVKYHLEQLGMNRSRAYPCLLIRRKEEQLEGLIILQVDDSLAVVTANFLREEEQQAKHFQSKPIDTLNQDDAEPEFNSTMFKRLTTATTDKGFANQRTLAQ